MLTMDEPNHTRLRSIVDEAFRRRAILDMEPRIVAIGWLELFADVPLLQAVDAQHRRERKWPTPSLWAEPGIVRLDQRFELRPRHHGRHLRAMFERLFTGSLSSCKTK